jgi:hypothetical protein
MAPIKKVPKVRIRYSERGMHLIGLTNDEYIVELVSATGSTVVWRHLGDLITFEIGEHAVMRKVPNGTWMSNDLYALLLASSTMLVKAVFKGYKKGEKKPQVVSTIPETPLFGVLPRQEGPIRHSRRRTRVAS